MDALAFAGIRTEAYTWLIAAVGAGQAAGTALAGALPAHPYAAALPAAGATACLLVLVGARRRLAGPGAPPGPPSPHPGPCHAPLTLVSQPARSTQINPFPLNYPSTQGDHQKHGRFAARKAPRTWPLLVMRATGTCAMLGGSRS